jgi:signal transduction histidine kinase
MVGVIELFSRQVQRPNPQMLQALKVMGTQIGQFIERKRAAEVLQKTLADLQASHEELKATQMELIQAAKLESLGTLAAGVAHEVKNPLQTILMGLDYFSRHVPLTDEAVKQILTDMRDAVVRADRIIHEMLHLSADSQILIKPENLNDLVERSLLLVAYKLTSGRINVVRELALGLPLLSLDRIRMEQVFLNLFINAMHAMPEGGTLTIRTRTDRWPDNAPRSTSAAHHLKAGDPIVVVEVQDSGVGIPEANLVKLFDPFFTTKPSGVGTGLGLSIIKKIMDLHDGLITIRNAPSRGVLVTLTLKAPAERTAAEQ